MNPVVLAGDVDPVVLAGDVDPIVRSADAVDLAVASTMSRLQKRLSAIFLNIDPLFE